MERNVTMAEISDGKLYSRDDMVKAGCDDCRGCSACCHGMGNSIVLDPYDVYRLTALRGDTLEHLLEEKKVEWNVVDGQILPNLALWSGADEACGFLDEVRATASCSGTSARATMGVTSYRKASSCAWSCRSA